MMQAQVFNSQSAQNSGWQMIPRTTGFQTDGKGTIRFLQQVQDAPDQALKVVRVAAGLL